eukprot:4855586-Pyramimonas_sp.AAC.1
MICPLHPFLPLCRLFGSGVNGGLRHFAGHPLSPSRVGPLSTPGIPAARGLPLRGASARGGRDGRAPPAGRAGESPFAAR